MEHIFHKIILNIYFDHIYIMCLYRVFSMFCTGYMLVYIKERVLFHIVQVALDYAIYKIVFPRTTQ